MWGRVASAIRRALGALVSRASDQSARARATHGPAQITAPRSSANGPKPSDLPVLIARRGQRLHNRNRAAARRFEEIHKALCFEARE
jgi:hypothetical protein